MSSKDSVTNFLSGIDEGIPGIIAISVVEIESGMTLASKTNGSFDPEIASAYNVEVLKAKFAAIKALGLKEKVDDILITLSTQIHIIKVTPNEKFMLYIAADSSKVNLGLARSVMKKNATNLEKTLK